MLYNKSLPFSTGWIIIWKTASRPEGGTFVTCGFAWSTCTDLFRKISREDCTTFMCISMFEATNCNYSSFKSELAHDNYTMTSLLFTLHVFCSIYCLISSRAQLQHLFHHFLCSSYPFMDHNYLALQSKQSVCTALADHSYNVSGICVSHFKI